MSYKKFAGEALIIALSQILTGLANFLILPLITKTLGAHDYGIWIQIVVTVTLLSQLALLQQQMALLRNLSSKSDEKTIKEEFFTLLAFVGIIGFVFTISMIVAIFAAPYLGIVLGEGMVGLLTIAAFMVPFSAFGAMTSAYFLASRKFKMVATVAVLTSFGQLSLTMILLSRGFGLTGVAIAALLVSICAFSISLAIIVKEIGFCSPKFHLLKPNLKFGLPLTPNVMISWITDSSDRYLVAWILSLSLAGIYSAAYGIGAVIFLIINPIQNALYPTLSRLYDNNEIDEVRSYLSRSMRYFLMLAIPAVVGLSALAEPLLVSLTTPDFASGYVVIPLVALAGLFDGVLTILWVIVHLVKKTHLSLITFTIPALANIALVIFLTPIWGIVGAALATTIAYAIMLLAGTIISSRYIKFSVDWKFVGKSTLSALLMLGAIELLNPKDLPHILLCIGIAAPVYFFALMLVKGLTDDELQLIRSSINRIFSKA